MIEVPEVEVTSDLSKIRKIQVRRVWSLMKVTNPCFLEELVTLVGPRTSLWTIVKGWLAYMVVREMRLDIV